MAFRLEHQEYLSCPVGALSLGVGARKGVLRICPCPSSVHFSTEPQASSGARLRGRGWDWRLPHICLPLSVTWAVEKDETFSKDNPYLSTYRRGKRSFQSSQKEVVPTPCLATDGWVPLERRSVYL